MKVGQRLKGDKFGLLYPSLRHLIGGSPVQNWMLWNLWKGYQQGLKFGSPTVTLPELLVIFKPWLTSFKKKSFVISTQSIIESGNSVGKKNTLHYIKGKIPPHCITGFSSLKSLNRPSALAYYYFPSGEDCGSLQEVYFRLRKQLVPTQAAT